MSRVGLGSGVRRKETYVWFSPLGAKKYARREATTTNTRPMMMLALLKRIGSVNVFDLPPFTYVPVRHDED